MIFLFFKVFCVLAEISTNHAGYVFRSGGKAMCLLGSIEYNTMWILITGMLLVFTGFTERVVCFIPAESGNSCFAYMLFSGTWRCDLFWNDSLRADP